MSFNQPYSFSQWGQGLLERLNVRLDKLTSDEELASVLIRQLAKERCLLVLDNLETLLADEARWQAYQQFLQKWLSRDTQSTILVTSQERPKLSLRASEWLPLAGLSSEAGVALLQSLTVQGSRECLQKIVRLADGHPLLLHLIVEWLRQERGEAANVDYVLSQSDLNLLTDVVGEHRDNPETNVGRVLEQMMERLEPRLQTLWFSLSVYRQSFGEAQAKAMLPDATIADLRFLARRSLLQEQPTQTSWQFSFLPLLKTFAQQQEGDQTSAHIKAFEYYNSVAQPEPWQAIEDIAPNLELFHHLCVLEQYKLAFDVLHDCQEFLSSQGYNKVLIEAYHQLAQGWKPSTEDKSDFIAIFAVLGDAHQGLGQFQEAIAYHQASLEVAQEFDNLTGESGALINLSWVYSVINQHQIAIQHGVQGLKIAKKIGHREWEANALKHLGIAHEGLEKYKKAIKYHQQALIIERELRNSRGIAGSLINLGRIYGLVNQFKKSIDFLDQGLKLARRISDHQYEANGLLGLGQTYDDLEQYQKATECCLEALAIYQRIGDRHGEAITLGNLGNIYNSMNDNHCAIDYHQKSLEVAREIGDRSWEAGSLVNMGIAYKELGRHQKAIECCQQGLEIAQQVQNSRFSANAWFHLGDASATLHQITDAIAAYENARDLYQLIGEENYARDCDGAIQELRRSSL